MGEYKILEDISANITLLQFMDSLGNVNHAISVVGSLIFDSKYERALVLNRSSLDMICAPSVVEEQEAMFEKFIMLSDTFILERNLRKDHSYMSTKNTVRIICVTI